MEKDEIARVWGKDGKTMSAGLGVYEKSVPGMDEDTATISVEAARRAVKSSGIDPKEIGAVYVGSESHPYAVKPTATIVGEAIGATPDMTAADYEFACKAGTAAIQTCMGLVKSHMIKYGLAVGADVSQAAPGDALELVSVIEHKAFTSLYVQELSQEGLPIEIVDVEKVPKTTVTIYPDELNKDVKSLDIKIPIRFACTSL